MMARPIYLDHNATTPVDPAVVAGMLPFFVEVFGNPSSATSVYGAEAALALEGARAQVANLVNARPTEVVFTSSCTEANNLAILGVARACPEKNHFITTAIEHPAILEPLHHLASAGARLTILPVNAEGRVDPDDVKGAITPETALVTVMGANNEVGSLQPLREIGAICREAGVLFHSDLAQLSAHSVVDVQRLHLSLASLSAHKAYGPKGVGALYVRSRAPRTRIVPILFGGGQERGLRPGTANVPLAVGMGLACEMVSRRATSDATHVGSLRRELLARILAEFPDAVVNGSTEFHLPNCLSLSIPGVEPYALIRSLRDTVSFSASSACASDTVHTSHVLLAMFGNTWRARNAFRLGLGRSTTRDQIVLAAAAICEHAARLRQLV